MLSALKASRGWASCGRIEESKNTLMDIDPFTWDERKPKTEDLIMSF